MNKATIEILSTLAVTGTAVVCWHKKNEVKALQELKTNGIVYIKETRHGYYIVRFGKSEMFDTPTVTRVYTPAV